MPESSLHSTSSTNDRSESEIHPSAARLVASSDDGNSETPSNSQQLGEDISGSERIGNGHGSNGLAGKRPIGSVPVEVHTLDKVSGSDGNSSAVSGSVGTAGTGAAGAGASGISGEAVEADQLDWQQILTENQSWLRRVLYSRLGELEAVDECMQEIGLAAVRQAAPIRDTSKVGSWLYQLAIRQSLLYRRKMGRKRNLLQRYADRNRPVESDQGAFDPLNWLLNREKVGTVRLALAEMKSDDREILLLKYGESWSYLQISDHLNITHSAVEARLHRARQRLRKLIESIEKQFESKLE